MFHSGTSTGTGRIGRLAGIAGLAVLIALLWSGLCAAQIDNPSFEESYGTTPWPRAFPSDWYPWDHPSFNSTCIPLSTTDDSQSTTDDPFWSEAWHTDGTQALIIYNQAGCTVFAGEYAGIWQFVDLTGVNCISFDAMLLPDAGDDFGPFEASFVVNGWPLWSQTEVGEYLDQRVDVSAYTGYCIVELRLTMVGQDALLMPDIEYGAFWDNLALCDGPMAVAAAVTLTPDTLVIDPTSPTNTGNNRGRRVTCYIELEENGEGYDAGDIDGSTVVLDDIPAYMGSESWARPEANYTNLIDIDSDGILERMVRFDRDAVEGILEAPETEVTIQGELLDGTSFVGTAVIQVIEREPRVPPRQAFQPARRAFTWRFQPPAHGKR